jgi:hypothetical protein
MGDVLTSSQRAGCGFNLRSPALLAAQFLMAASFLMQTVRLDTLYCTLHAPRDHWGSKMQSQQKSRFLCPVAPKVTYVAEGVCSTCIAAAIEGKACCR